MSASSSTPIDVVPDVVPNVVPVEAINDFIKTSQELEATLKSFFQPPYAPENLVDAIAKAVKMLQEIKTLSKVDKQSILDQVLLKLINAVPDEKARDILLLTYQTIGPQLVTQLIAFGKDFTTWAENTKCGVWCGKKCTIL